MTQAEAVAQPRAEIEVCVTERREAQGSWIERMALARGYVVSSEALLAGG